MVRTWRAGVVCGFLTMGLAGAAGAEGTAGEERAAALFKAGLADMLAERFDSGCPALAESQQLDPRAGTLFTLAECWNKAGKVASASARYSEYLRMFAQLDAEQQKAQRGRELVSAQQLAALMPQVPKLTLVLPPDAPAGTVIQRDGVALERPALGIATPVDPGEHLISIEAPGRVAHEMRIAMGAGELKRLVVEIGPVVNAPPPDPVVAAEPPDDGSTLRTAGLVVGGAGLAGLLVGVITGAMATSAYGDAKDNCDGTVCNQEGLDAVDRTKPLGNASTAGFVVGGVALAAGVLMFLLAPSEAAPAPGAEGQVQEARVRVRPWASSTGAAGAVAGVEGAW